MAEHPPAAPPNAFHFRIPEIRLGEFDLGGVLYHANYFHLYEAGREAFLREHGVAYASLVAENSHLAIVESHQCFFAPVFYGEALALSLWPSDIGRSSLVFNYEISRDGQRATVIHSAWTKMVFIRSGSTGFRPAQLPQPLSTAARRYLVPVAQ